MRIARMDVLMRECSELVSRLPGVSVTSPVNCQPCRSLTYGDICLGRRITSAEEGEILAALSKSDVFVNVRRNPHGQICLALNRPHVFRSTIQEVLESRSKYGLRDSTSPHTTLVADYYTSPRDNDPGSHCCQRQLSVSEGRILLIKKLVIRILKKTGHCVKEGLLTKKGLESREKDLVPEDLVQNFFGAFCSFPNSTTPPSEPDSTSHPSEPDSTSHPSEPNSTSHPSEPDSTSPPSEPDSTSPPSEPTSEEETFLSCLKSSDYVSSSRPHPPHSLICDGKRFLREKGKQYDKNIDKVKVRAGDGTVTEVASLACQLLGRLEEEDEPSQVEDVIHVTGHSSSFKLQQAMILADVCVESRKRGMLSQHLILCSEVEVSEDGTTLKHYPLARLLQVRHRQMMAAFGAKYDSTAHVSEAQSVVTAMTEAVVKFELLSTDPQAKIKLTVPSQASAGSGVRFAGSFVLYNYARLANVLNTFERACKFGTYPPLPDLTFIDFTLLSDEEEWQILFHFILQYPTMVNDIYNSVCDRGTVCLHAKLKKICQFLTQLSHSVSTYYSRVKILMTPEPHLFPLIHARLLLVMAIKQTMYNALHLLAIEPPEQL